jgi:hypothetical protein
MVRFLVRFLDQRVVGFETSEFISGEPSAFETSEWFESMLGKVRQVP